MKEIDVLLKLLGNGDKKALARCISIVENNIEGSADILTQLSFEHATPIIGITGPPGAGKSTLFKVISGNLKQDKGDIYFNSLNINNLIN